MPTKKKGPTLLERSNTPEDPSTASPERDLCQKCGLFREAQTPFMNPPPKRGWTGRLMILGEGPGEHEDARSGRFFSGRSGNLLYELLAKVGFTIGKAASGTATDETFWNTVRCRPKDNATPTMEQIRCCRPYFLNKIDTLKPKYILGLGASAAKCITNSGDANVVGTRGRPLKVERGSPTVSSS